MDANTLARLLGPWSHTAGPLYQALAQALHGLVRSGELPAGMRLPSERRLAEALNVSRGTVVAAYDALRSEDVLRARQGSGTVVVGPRVPGIAAPGAGAWVRSTVAEALDVNVLGHHLGPGSVDLRPGYWVDTNPRAGLPEAAFSEAATDLQAELNGSGYFPAGVPALREQIARHYTEHRQLPTTADQIMVTTGAQQAIHLAGTLALRPGDAVAVEPLTYIGALDVFRVLGARPIPLPVQNDRPRLFYVMAEAHNPMGNAMAANRRKRLLAQATAADALVVDDQAGADLWLGPSRPPSLAETAEAKGDPTRVLTVGSASKTFWGGLRVGWIRGAPAHVNALTGLKAACDVSGAVPAQLLAARLFPHLGEILDRRLPELCRRRDALAEAVAAHFPQWSFRLPDGGLWLWADTGGDARPLVEAGMRHGVGILAGGECAPGPGYDRFVRFTFGQAPEILEEGVRRLAAAWADTDAAAPPASGYQAVM